MSKNQVRNYDLRFNFMTDGVPAVIQQNGWTKEWSCYQIVSTVSAPTTAMDDLSFVIHS